MVSDERNPSTDSSSYTTTRGSVSGSIGSRSENEDRAALEDEKLLHLIENGDRSALEVLYNRYAGGIYSLAHHMLQEQGAAEEVTQDTFFNVWRRASSYNVKRGKVSGWLYSIGHHRIIDELRKRRRQESMIYVPDVEAVHRQEDESADPNEYAAQRMQGSRIRKALEALRPELKSVVVLAYYGGLTQSEIAKKLNQPLGTVKTRTRLALKALRENLGPHARKWLDD
jgi:RNA polymerase sigma-70 factor (ECF subfamily)